MTVAGPRLKDLGMWLSGGTPPRDRADLWEGDIRWISAKDIDRTVLRQPTAFVTPEAAAMYSRVVPPGALLIIVRGMALAHGLPVVVTDDAVCFNQDLRALLPNRQYDARYIYYALLGARRRIDAHIDKAAHGTARLLDSAYSERLWMPGLEDQRGIAAFLDRECGRIDKLLEKLDCFEGLLAEERVADLEPLCFPLVVGDYWFGSTPDGWETRPVGSLGSLFDGDWVESPYITDSGIRLIQTGNVGRGEFKAASSRFISDETFVELRCSEVLPGDVLFSRLNLPMGRACVAPSLDTRMVASVDVAILRSREIDARWLVALASSERWLNWMEQLARGTTMVRIARSQLSQVRVPVPPRSVQTKIGDVFFDAQRKAARQVEVIGQMRERLREYRDAVIAEAVTGQLEVQDPSDGGMDERLNAIVPGQVLA